MEHPLLRTLPPGLEALADLALDLRWTWSHAGDRLWQTIDPKIWASTENPWLILQSISQRRLEELAADDGFRGELARLAQARSEYLSASCWFGDDQRAAVGAVAYFSMEYGLGEALPIYSGGLGILAGDHLKTASDLGVPLVAVGLLYQEGYFRQVLDADGRQTEVYPNNVPTSMPIMPVRDAEGAWLGVPLGFPGRTLVLRVWQARVGRVSLYLLDSNDPMNSAADRGITAKLYGGGEEMRLMQEIALGIGGWRALKALGVPVEVCHLNEGHAALMVLERARDCMQQTGLSFREALWATRAGNVFTTHTPVAAGFDRYDPALIGKYFPYYRTFFEQLGISRDELLGLGRRDPQDRAEPFNMAYLAMRGCLRVNGVSRLHGAVSRRLFQPLYPRWPEREVPVTHVTNGVHVPSWDSPWADGLWTQACGKDRWLGTLETHAAAIQAVSDETLWGARSQERADLVGYARRRLASQLGQRGAEPQAVAAAETVLDPNVLTLGFARRFTDYKRPSLLLHDPERLVRLLTNPARPAQLIVAGKAHPRDEQGKEFVRAWVQFVRRPEVRPHAVFLEDYDMSLAEELVQGVDVWINTPRRPWEACGTSGMKVLANGGLNLSELDGWWAEAYSPEVGWALGDGEEHPEPSWDAVEAEALYRLLEQAVVPAFYDRDASGIPRGWVARVRASLARLAPQFSSNRMVREYVQQMYLPLAAAYRRRTADGGRLARELRAWAEALNAHWHEIHLGGLEVRRDKGAWSFAVPVYLGGVDPEAIAVQLYADPAGSEPAVVQPMARGVEIPGAHRGYRYTCRLTTGRAPGDFTPRVVPYHPQASVPAEAAHILWGMGIAR